jgi:uncharacterized membrane protein
MEDAPSTPASETRAQTGVVKPQQKTPVPTNVEPPMKRLSTKLTRLHAHPIAVHIPNGVLPITVLMALLAWLFEHQGIAIAAKINMVFVAASMPFVVLSGIIDWKNRFKGRMTKVFRNKLICAGIVTLLSLVLVIWGFSQPEIFIQGSSALFFLVLHLINLGAAAIAGWYGGKLVFPKK